jgi:hypothetical protein
MLKIKLEPYLVYSTGISIFLYCLKYVSNKLQASEKNKSSVSGGPSNGRPCAVAYLAHT